VSFAPVHLDSTRCFEPSQLPEPQPILKQKRLKLKLRLPKLEAEPFDNLPRESESRTHNLVQNKPARTSFQQRTAGISFQIARDDTSSTQGTARIPSLESTRARNRFMTARIAPLHANETDLSPFYNQCKLSPSPAASPKSEVNPSSPGEVLKEILYKFGGVEEQQTSQPVPDQDLPISPRSRPESLGDPDASSVPRFGLDMGAVATTDLSEKEVRPQQRELRRFQRQEAQEQAVSPRGRSTSPPSPCSQIFGAWQINTRRRQASVIHLKEGSPFTQPSQTTTISRSCVEPHVQQGELPQPNKLHLNPAASPLPPSSRNTPRLSPSASLAMTTPGTPEFLKYMQDGANRKEAEGEPMVSGILMREAFRGAPNVNRITEREKTIKAAAKGERKERESTNNSVSLKLTTGQRNWREDWERESKEILAELMNEPSTSTTRSSSYSSPATSLLRGFKRREEITVMDSTSRPTFEIDTGTTSSTLLGVLSDDETESLDTGSEESECLSDLSEEWSERESLDSNEEETSLSPTQLPPRRQSG
jgi:hypothetical protein